LANPLQQVQALLGQLTKKEEQEELQALLGQLTKKEEQEELQELQELEVGEIWFFFFFPNQFFLVQPGS
jgi:hypothetical protein